MADYNLSYFVEGKDAFGLVKISKDDPVALLAQDIHRKLSYCKGIDPWQIDLLKVDIDHTSQPIIRNLQAPDGATKMDTMQLINEIWLDQPNQRHFHICVRLPGDFMLVDFDWDGKRVGEASSPTLELNPELLEDRMSDDLITTEDDDVSVLTKTLEKL
ncbi:hypothetical protein EDB85DRAFT_2140739 [Lactarius pseudohatsudake]|nr:hypothetical protein EDB85DRAFT_2140739 [Lactarius pseudohatsudake]